MGHTLIVAGKRYLATNVVALTLRSANGSPLPPWQPGAHIELLLGSGSNVLRRHYSLCGRPTDPEWRIAVYKEPDGRGGSAYVHDNLAVGDVVEFSGPRNHFPLEDSDAYLFISGGIGITPILPMVHRAEAMGKEWRLICCARDQGRIVFADELATLPSGRVHVHLDEVEGLLDLDAVLQPLGAETSVYVCGPPGLLRAVEDRAESGAWRYHFERFSPTAPADTSDDVPFKLVAGSTNTTYVVEAGVSALDVLNENGFDIPFSCREGTCGTCETGVLEGEPDHRDSVLSAKEKAENTVMMVCVSRAKNDRLVLDI